jgi:hypothetical protein
LKAALLGKGHSQDLAKEWLAMALDLTFGHYLL